MAHFAGHPVRVLQGVGPKSAARLAALARAYANLSQLTLYHWSEEPNVYAARALLYAQRLAAADPKSKTALWTRAYAKALVGLERSAMEDLDAAGDGPDAPAWVAMLKAFCNYQTDKLSELAGASEHALRALAMQIARPTRRNLTRSFPGAALDCRPTPDAQR